jgi:hypothetical protein
MQATLLRHLRRNAVAYLALFVALAGTSFAAATVITGKDVKNSSLTGKDVKNSSLTGTDVKNKSLAPADFNGSVQGPKGDTGAKGEQGIQGIQGVQGVPGDSVLSYAHINADGTFDAARSKGVLDSELLLPNLYRLVTHRGRVSGESRSSRTRGPRYSRSPTASRASA